MPRDNSPKEKYIAFVCTGNTCRSPMAEGIFNYFAKQKGIAVVAESFGVSTISGCHANDLSIEVCREADIDLSGFRTSSVEDVDLDKYERLYCMTAGHAQLLYSEYNVDADKLFAFNVIDPYGQGKGAYELCFSMLYGYIEEMISEYEN